ncbi:MAG: hypothetical protein ABIT10_05455 [Alteraurantiacibacter sp.]
MNSALLFLAVLALPLLAGFALARARPQMSGFRAGLCASLVLLAAFLAYCWHLAGGQGAGQTTPLALPALLVFGLIAWLMGFGLAFFGHSLGRRKP